MADSKISELTALTSPASDDVLAIVDTDAGVTKKITVSNLQSSSFQFVLEDGDGTEVTINNNNEVKFVEGGGIDINWTDTDNGSDADPYDLTFSIDSTVATLTGSQTLTNKTLTSPVLNTGVSGTAIKDEDNMASDSATHLATQQSIKAYVDSTVAATNELVEDSSPQLGGDLDLNSNNITGTGNINITGGLTATSASTISVTDNSDTLTLASTDADANNGPKFVLNRDSGSPADGDNCGIIKFKADDDGGNSTELVNISATFTDVSNGAEDATFNISSVISGSQMSRFKSTASETVLNDDSGDIDFRVESDGNANMFHINGGSNIVGIGADPDLGSGLHIKSADSGADVFTDTIAVLENSGDTRLSILSGTSGEGEILFGDSGLNRQGRIAYRHNGDKFVFQTANAERMTLDSSGNLGIGTSSIDVITQAGGSGYRVLQLENNEGGQINLDHTDAGTGSTLGMINFNRAGETVAHIGGVTDGATDSGQINFRTQPASGALTERMRITSAGKVGIGTSSPTRFVQLKDTSADMYIGLEGGTSNTVGILFGDTDNHTQSRIQHANSDNSLRFSTVETERMRIFSGGNVSIGTTGDPGKLTVSTASTSGLVSSNADELVIEGTRSGMTFLAANDNFSYINFGDNGAADRGSIRYGHSADSFSIQTAAAERMSIDSSGRVGIGTSSPEDVLHVLGSESTAVDIGTDASAEVVAQFIPDSTNSRNGRLKIAGTNIPSNNSVALISDASSNVGFSFNVKGSSITEAMVITSDGNVAIGTTDVIQDFGDGRTSLALKGTGSQDYATVQLANNGTSADDQILGILSFYDGTEHNARIDTIRASNTVSAHMRFWTAPSGGGIIERMRIHTGGEATFNTTNTAVAANAAGVVIGDNGYASFRRGSATVMYLNRFTNDGTLVAFHQAGTEEGSIEVSGSTVSYNGFTGSHWSRLADNSKPTILRGTIMDSIDEMCDWYQAVSEVAESTDDEGNVTPAHTVKESISLGDKSIGDEITFTSNGTEYTGTIVKEDDVKHNKCKVSDTEDSKKVYGVFSNWDDADDGLDGDVNDMNIAQVGTFVIRVNADVTVEAGDLLVSNGDGTAKIQDDDIIRSKTVAKVNSNVIIETYSDGSYTVPCTLHC